MKLKVYLDTNIVIDFFINQAKGIRRKEKAKIPKKLTFFSKNLDRLEFITSLITKAEIVRELAAGYGISDKDIEGLWEEFIKLLECEYVERVVLDERFVDYPKKIRMKLRTLMNFQHLFVAIKENAHILSGDKDLIKVVRQNKIYSKILSYIELRKMIT